MNAKLLVFLSTVQTRAKDYDVSVCVSPQLEFYNRQTSASGEQPKITDLAKVQNELTELVKAVQSARKPLRVLAVAGADISGRDVAKFHYETEAILRQITHNPDLAIEQIFAVTYLLYGVSRTQLALNSRLLGQVEIIAESMTEVSRPVFDSSEYFATEIALASQDDGERAKFELELAAADLEYMTTVRQRRWKRIMFVPWSEFIGWAQCGDRKIDACGALHQFYAQTIRPYLPALREVERICEKNNLTTEKWAQRFGEYLEETRVAKGLGGKFYDFVDKLVVAGIRIHDIDDNSIYNPAPQDPIAAAQLIETVQEFFRLN